MKIGLISDTHNNVHATVKAARIFIEHKVEAVLHCGDVGSPRILEELYVQFYDCGVPLYVVWGNCDYGVPELMNYPELDGLHLCGRFGLLEIGGKKIGLMHGDDHREYCSQAESGGLDYLVSGHTHVAHDQTYKTTRLLNPGSAARSRKGPESCAVLDLDTDDFDLITLSL